MSVTVTLSRSLYYSNDDKATVMVEGDTVGKCLDALVKKLPALKPKLADNNGKLHNNINIFINQEFVRSREMAKRVRDGDEIFVARLIGGG
jgi:molybdopterin converting factor small subunit